MEANQKKSPGFMASFVNGGKKGVNLVLNTAIPSVAFAFGITRMLTISGILGLMGKILSPVMFIFGLPGEAAVPMVISYVSLAGGLSSTASMVESGVLTGTEAITIIPFMFLTGAVFVYTARVLSVTGIKSKDFKIPYIIAIINAILSIFVMRIILSFI